MGAHFLPGVQVEALSELVNVCLLEVSGHDEPLVFCRPCGVLDPVAPPAALCPYLPGTLSNLTGWPTLAMNHGVQATLIVSIGNVPTQIYSWS